MMHTHVFTVLFVIVVFLVLPLILYGIYGFRSPIDPQTLSSTLSPIPPLLWTYHAASSTPEQRYALQTWRTHHPTWSIRILTPDTVHGYLHGLPRWENAGLLRQPMLWEDLIALHAIHEHGGIWLESTTALQQPIKLPEKEVAVLLLPTSKTLIRRHAFAGRKKSPFFAHWYNEYLRLLQYPSVTHYLKSIFTSTPLRFPSETEDPHSSRKLGEPSLDALAQPEEHVTALALEHALLKHPFPPESIATKGVFMLSCEGGERSCV